MVDREQRDSGDKQKEAVFRKRHCVIGTAERFDSRKTDQQKQFIKSTNICAAWLPLDIMECD